MVLDQNSTNEAYVIGFLDQIIMGFGENVGVVDQVDLTWEQSQPGTTVTWVSAPVTS